jgi:nucleoside-diphosphate-sugar epimerase
LKSTVSIIGLGWLGLPLYKFLESKGYVVKGSKTNLQKVKELNLKNINAFHLELIPEIVSIDIKELLMADILVINIPPDRKREDAGENYYNKIKYLVEEVCLSSIKHVIFISSTSVYGDTDGTKTEESETIPDTSSAEGLIYAEKLLLDQTEFSTTVLRFGGLVGPSRNPSKFLMGSDIKSAPYSPINLIHQIDCLQIIEKIIQEKCWAQIFNAVSDHHPTRIDYYTNIAKRNKIEIPKFNLEDKKSGKIISSEKLKAQLEYSFTYPDPFLFEY